MQDNEKIKIIQTLLMNILTQNELYIQDGIYYDYSTVIGKLSEAFGIMENTVRCPRPVNVPEDIAWNESMNPEYEFNPFVYDGNMSNEDFEKAQKLSLLGDFEKSKNTSLNENNSKNAKFSKEFLLDMKIPVNKIMLEINSKKTFMGFPFFLRRVRNDGKEVEVILMHNYPEARRVIVRMRTNGKFPSIADKTEKLILSEDLIVELLSDDFVWYHESEMDTMW